MVEMWSLVGKEVSDRLEQALVELKTDADHSKVPPVADAIARTENKSIRCNN
jgi:hypothetical protein